MPRSGTLCDQYPDVAEILAPELRQYAVEDVETLLRQHFGVESIESFGRAFRRIRRSATRATRAVPAAMPVLRTVARTAAPLLPVAGQAAGTLIGGPAGAMVGGLVGNMAGQALGGRAQQRAPVTGTTSGQAGALLGGMPASAKLINILGRPEILKALMSMALGPAGNPSTSVAGRQVPVAAIANLIGSLAQQASEDFRIATDGAGESLPEYLTDATGEPCCEIADPDGRASRLYELLVLSDSIHSASVYRTRPLWREASHTQLAYDDDFDASDDADLGEILANEALEWE